MKSVSLSVSSGDPCMDSTSSHLQSTSVHSRISKHYSTSLAGSRSGGWDPLSGRLDETGPRRQGVAYVPNCPIIIGFTIENAYLATQMIAFWSIYQAAINERSIDKKRGRASAQTIGDLVEPERR